VQLRSSDPTLFFYPPEIAAMGDAATAAHNNANGTTCTGLSWDVLQAEPAVAVTLPEARGEDICYLQYSSGSTRFPTALPSPMPRCSTIWQAMARPWITVPDAASAGCRGITTWVWSAASCRSSPIRCPRLSRTEDFARRPLAWLDLITRNPGTSISYSPTFGYDICARRISSQSHVDERFDLSRWRLAGNGADMIRPDVMQGFVNAFAPAGFKASAFLPSYGLAEATLSVTIMPPGEGIRVELVEEERLSGTARDLTRPARYRAIVNCGKPVKDMVVEIRDGAGRALADHHIGKVWCKGPSVMHSYFRDPESTDACLVDGWLDTGDMGYNVDGYLFIVGRAKDMIIINGKNHWPQDIEWAVEQLPGFHQGDIAAFSLETETGEETAAVLVHCRVSDPVERMKLKTAVAEKVRSILGHPAVVELVPPRTLPRTSSGKLSRAKAKKLYLSGEIEPLQMAA
jgi:fatty-acyl-CoA synthase